MKKLLTLALTLLMVASLLPIAQAEEPVTLKIWLRGDITGLDRIAEEFYNRTKDTLNIRLSFNCVAASDYKDKLLMAMTEGEDIDLVFDANWLLIPTFGPEGAYVDLIDYFHNPEYPGLQKAFDEDFIAANKFYGKTIAVPITNSFTDMPGLNIRKDLMEKYGFEEIRDNDELIAFLDIIAENEPDMAPWAIAGARGFYRVEPLAYTDEVRAFNQAMRLHQVWSNYCRVYLSEDYKTVEKVLFAGMPEDAFAVLADTPYEGKDPMLVDWLNKRALNQYAQADSISYESADANELFYTGRAAVLDGEIGGIANRENELQKSFPEASIYFYPYSAAVRLQESGAMTSGFQAWNFLCVPQTSKNVDKTMQFLNWIFESQENHDLFEFGVQGVDWEPIGDSQFRSLQSDYNFNQFAYEMTWNTNYVRYNEALSPESVALLQYQADKDTYLYSPIAGFTFDNSGVTTEIASLNALTDEVYIPLQQGIYEDPAAVLSQLYQDCMNVGLQNVLDEIESQLQAFLTERYSE